MLTIEIHVDCLEESTSTRASRLEPGAETLRRRINRFINRFFSILKRLR